MYSKAYNILQSIGLLFLRLGFGIYMSTHGWGKMQMVINGQFDDFGNPIGMGKPASLILAAFAEFICAWLVVVGLGTRFAATAVVITMGVAAFIVHQNDPWTMGAGASKEPALLFLTAFLALIFTGPGKFSIDHLICRKFCKNKVQ